MKIAVIGVGAVGGYFGGRLAESGANVTFIARGKTYESLSNNGLIVKSVDGDFNVKQCHVVDSIAKAADADLFLIATKAWQVKDIAKEIKEIIKPDAVVIPMQNGVLAADELSEILGKKHVIGGLCKILAKIDIPAKILHFGVSPIFIFGELDHVKTERSLKIQSIFDKAKFNTIHAEDIHAELWKKFLAICVSGLLAVTRSSYGVVRELPETREMMKDLFTEIYNVSQKVGINLSATLVDKTMAFIDTFPYDSTSSLTRDVIEGRLSEIEYQNGTVVRLGKKYGVPTPVNKFIYNTILPMEMKARNE